MILRKNGYRVWFDSNPQGDKTIIDDWLETNDPTSFPSNYRRFPSQRPYKTTKKRHQKPISILIKSIINEADEKDKARAPVLRRLEKYDRRIAERMLKRRQEML